MNRFIFISLFLATSSFLKAQVEVFEGSFQEALHKVKKEKQYLIVDFYTSWCGYCKKFDREVLAVPEVGAYVKNRFVVYKCNAEIEKNVALNYSVKGYPTLLILNDKADVVNRKNGFVNKAAFLALLQSLNVKEKAQTADYVEYLELAQLDFDQELMEWKSKEEERALFLERLQEAITTKDVLAIEDLMVAYPESEGLISFFEKEVKTQVSTAALKEALNNEWLSPQEVGLFLKQKLIVNSEKVESEHLILTNELLLFRKDATLMALKMYVLVNLDQLDYAKKYQKESLKELKKMKQSSVLIEAIKL